MMLIKNIAIPGGKMGQVGKIQIKAGDSVTGGDIVAQVESAKGNQPIKATTSGVILKILCEEGSEIASHAEMLEVAESEIIALKSILPTHIILSKIL